MFKRLLALATMAAIIFGGLVASPMAANASNEPGDASLSNLYLRAVTNAWWGENYGQSMAPNFSSEQSYYEAFSTFESIRIHATVASEGATISVTGGDVSNESLPSGGDLLVNFPAQANNLVTITVTASDQTSSKVYKINMSNVVMPQPELVSIAPTVFSTAGGDSGVAFVRHAFHPSFNCHTNVYAKYKYKNSRGESRISQEFLVDEQLAPDANGISKIILSSRGIDEAFRDTTVTSDVLLENECGLVDSLTTAWAWKGSQNSVPNVLTYFNPTVTSVVAPATISQRSILTISGPGANNRADLDTYLLNPATGHKLWLSTDWVNSNSYKAVVSWGTEEEWRSAKKLKLIVEHYDDENDGEPVILFSKEFKFAPRMATQVSLTPAKGPLRGGNTVKISGVGLCNDDTDGPPIVKIGGQAVNNMTEISCASYRATGGDQFDALDKFSFTVPASFQSGAADISLDIGYGPITLSQKYIYGDRPTISSVSPSTVSNAGGSMLTLVGTNFGVSGTPTVTIDGQKSPQVIRVSATKVLAMVPESASTGVVELNLISSSGGGALDSPSSIMLSTSRTSPTISKLSKLVGGVAGGDSLVITGTGFVVGATGVKFGEVPAKITAATATQLTVEIPSADDPGAVSISVGTPTGLLVRVNAFSFIATPGVSSATPSTIKSTDIGSAARVTILGSGFKATGTIAVGSAKPISYTASEGGTRISGIAIPTAKVGVVSLVITPAGSKVPFTTSVSVTGPTISYIGPNPRNPYYGDQRPFAEDEGDGLVSATATTAGGTVISIEGSGFGSAGKVKMGKILVTPSSYSDTAILFESPEIAKGSYPISVIPSTGSVTALQAAAVNVGGLYPLASITKIESTVNNARSEARYTFAPAEDTSDLFTITGKGFLGGDNGVSTKVHMSYDEDDLPIYLTTVSVTDTEIIFHAPRNLLVRRWQEVRVDTKASSLQTSGAVFYTGASPEPTAISSRSGLCTMGAIGGYTPDLITATGEGVFGEAGTVSLGGITLPQAAVTWSANSVTIDLSKQTSELANPWGVKPLVFTPSDPTLQVQNWSYSCAVNSQVTTKLNGMADELTIAAGTSITASTVLSDPLPATTFVATKEQYSFQSAEDHSRDAWRYNVRSGLPTAAGEWYVRVNVGAATWDRDKYSQISNQNEVRLTLTGISVTFTPKLAVGTGTTLTYKGQLGDGTDESSNDIDYTKSATSDAVTSVSWQFRNRQCSVTQPNSAWYSGLPKDVAFSDTNCGGDGTTITSWDIRVSRFEMISGGIDKAIYYRPTFNTFSLTINKKSVTLSAVKAEKVFDGNNSVTLGEITLSGAVKGDNPTLDPSFATGASFSDSTAGASKTINLSGQFKLSNYWANNYSISNPGLVITGKILKADATIRLEPSVGSVILGNTPSVALSVSVKDNRTNLDQIAGANAPTPVLVNKSSAVCSLSGTTVTPIRAGECVIQATQPASANYNAAVSYHDDTTTTEEIKIKIYGAPKVLSIVADDIQVASGEQVNPSASITGLIDGDGFDNVQFSYYQGTTLLDNAPTAVGTYKIVPYGGSITAADSNAYSNALKYVSGKLVITASPPVVISISPAHGPEAGGNTMTITGSGFGTVTSITFGELTIRKPKFVVNGTGSSLSFKVPKGVGAVTVMLNAGSAQVSANYSYDPKPVSVDAPFKTKKLNDKTYVFSGFYFEYAQPELTSEGVESMTELATELAGAKTITLYGYTETLAKTKAMKAANITLAQNRCDSIVSLLKKLGVEAKFATVAKGGVNPVSQTDQSKNRRVEITVTY